MENIHLHYFLHGLIILMVGLLGGFPFASAIKHKTGKETAWRVVHSGSSMAGVMLIAIGIVTDYLCISPILNCIIFWGIISSTYLFVVAMVLAAAKGQRGIGTKETPKTATWKIVYYMYGAGAALSIVSIALLIIVCAGNLL